MNRVSSIDKYTKNKRINSMGFTLIELLAVIAILSIVSVIVMYTAINVIGSAKDKSYQVSIGNIEKEAGTYALENQASLSWQNVGIDTSKQYYCVTVQNLIDTGYFDSDILESEVSSGVLVDPMNYVYLERDTETKTVTKNILLFGSATETYSNLCISMKANGIINYEIEPLGWSKSKNVTVKYTLGNYTGEIKKYHYYYGYKETGEEEFVLEKNDEFSSKSYSETISFNKNGTLVMRILDTREDAEEPILVNKSLNITKIDNTGPRISVSISNGTTYTKNKDAVVKLVDNESGFKVGNYKVYYDWSMTDMSCEQIKNSSTVKSINFTIGTDNLNSTEEKTINISGKSGAGKLYVCGEGITDYVGNAITSDLVSSDMYLDNTRPVITFGTYAGTSDVKQTVTIPIVVSDTYSGVDSNSFTSSDVTVKVNNVTLDADAITITREDDNNYNLTIENKSKNGAVTISIGDNKVLDKATNGNEAVEFTPGITFKNTYTINYYLGDGTSTPGATQLGTTTCNYDEACKLATFSELNGVFPFSTDYNWAFYGWASSTAGTKRTYTLDNGATVNLSDGATIPANSHYTDIVLYAYGRKYIYFDSGVAPTSHMKSLPQYWNPYSTGESYRTTISIPEPTDIDGWTFIGYEDSNTASSTVVYDPDDIGITVRPTYDLKPRTYRSVYKRTVTVSYNANGGTGTTESTTGTQYYNSGYVSSSTNHGANVSTVPLTLSSNNFIYTGRSFSKWAEGSSSGTQYSSGESYGFSNDVLESSSVTMYAVWRKNKVYVKFHVNGGKIAESTTYSGTTYSWSTSNSIVYRNTKDNFFSIEYGESRDLPNPDGTYMTITKAGYIPDSSTEWTCYSGSGCINDTDVFNDGDDYDASKFCDASNGDCTVTLKLKWETALYTLNFDANGGSVTPATTSVTYGSKYGELPTPTREGYDFGGWYKTLSVGDLSWTAASGKNYSYKSVLLNVYPGITYTVTMDSAVKNSGSATKFRTLIYDFTDGKSLVSVDTSFSSSAVSYTITSPTTTDSSHDVRLLIYAGVSGSTAGNKVTYSNIKISTMGTTTQAKYTKDSTVSTAANHTLFADWSKKSYTITYDANGCGTAPSPSTATKYYGDDLTLSSLRTINSGYTFLGWATASSASSATYGPTGNYSNNESATLYAVCKQTLAKYVTDLYTNASKTAISNNSISYNHATSQGLMNDRLGSSSTGADSGNVRYYGANPNNYIYFNCDTYPGTTCEKWRIIGVFTVDGVKRVKIIRSSPLSVSLVWDNRYIDNNFKCLHGGQTYYGSNDWSISRVMMSLNPNDYYNSTYSVATAGSYWYRQSGNCYTTINSSSVSSCDFSSTGLKTSTGLTESMISTSTWDTGGINVDESQTYFLNNKGYADYFYLGDHGSTSRWGSTKTTWVGRVGLMYASDYAYGGDFGKCTSNPRQYGNSQTCRDNNWLVDTDYNIATMSHQSNNGIHTFTQYGNSGLSYFSLNCVGLPKAIYPTLYLDEDVYRVSGSGTSSDPYKINMG